MLGIERVLQPATLAICELSSEQLTENHASNLMMLRDRKMGTPCCWYFIQIARIAYGLALETALDVQ